VIAIDDNLVIFHTDVTLLLHLTSPRVSSDLFSASFSKWKIRSLPIELHKKFQITLRILRVEVKNLNIAPLPLHLQSVYQEEN